MSDPIKQFEIVSLISFGKIGGYEIALTNSGAYMLLTAGVVSGALIFSSRRRSLVPGRWQAAVEMLYEFISSTLRNNAGEQGMRFFPLVFSLFMFVLTANLIGLLPYSFTVTSHLFVTFTLAMLVFLTVTIYGIWRHGFGFFRLFLPHGVPIALAPIMVPIEIISYLARPVSHSVRLFAVMLAGHITLKVFAGFVVSLLSFGAAGAALAILPLMMTLIITALELLMAIIQAYIFTMLTCMYINDAIHPSH